MLIERKRAISPPFAAQSFKMGLLPLEFSDCLIDSPYFRENLKAHEKQLDRVSELSLAQRNVYRVYTHVTSLCATAMNERDRPIV